MKKYLGRIRFFHPITWLTGALILIGLMLGADVIIKQFSYAIVPDNEFTLFQGQTAALTSGNDKITFRLNDLQKSTSDPSYMPKGRWYPDSVTLSVFYKGVTYEAWWQSNHPSEKEDENSSPPYVFTFQALDDDKDGADRLIPYEIRLHDYTFGLLSHATFTVHKKEYTQIEMGIPFTVRPDEMALLESGLIGVTGNISSGHYTSEPPSWQTRYVVNGKDQYIDQSTLPPNGIEEGGWRLKLLDTDHETFSTFVMEKM